MSDTHAAIVADMVKALEPFAELAQRWEAYIRKTQPEYTDELIDESYVDEAEFIHFRRARAALARANLLDLDRACRVWVRENHLTDANFTCGLQRCFEDDVAGYFIPLRPTPGDSDV